VSGHERIVIENVDTAMRGSNFAQLAIDLLNYEGLARVLLRIEQASAWPHRNLQRMYDERGGTALAKCANPLFEVGHNSLHCLFNTFGRQTGKLIPQIGREVGCAHRKYNAIWFEAIKSTLFVENLLGIGVELSDVNC